MKNKSLTFKLVFGGIIAVLLPLIVVGFFSINKAGTALRTATHEKVLAQATDLSHLTDVFLNEELRFAKEIAGRKSTVAAATSLSLFGEETALPKLEALRASLYTTMKTIGEEYEVIFLLDKNGKIVADSLNGKLLGLDLSHRDYFATAKKGQASISVAVKSKATGNPVVPACAPVYAETGEIVGAVGISLNIDLLAEKIGAVKAGKTGYAFMVDQTGLIVAHPNKKHILETNLAKTRGLEKIMTAMLAGQTGVEEYEFEGIHKLAAFAPVAINGWSIGVTQPVAEYMGAANSIRNIILLVGCIFLLLTVVGVLLVARSISKPISVAIEGLNNGADQVSAAATQVASASQSLAEGSSEQAASIEETSASLEEMSSMTKMNADNAKNADNLMSEVKQIVASANASMKDLTTSMAKISESSDKTSKIIKTIDEIAFQTNLLALNAAVEAARAGDAGAGFAVVAEEVRNLAMRAADAAKDTSALIEDTVTRIHDGSDLVNVTNEAFVKVANSSTKVGHLIAEISAASNEQAQGIMQTNSAVGEMDKVVQQNAANAEESASASEELSAQAEQMKAMVNDLVMLVRGGSAKVSGGFKVRPKRKDMGKMIRGIRKKSLASTPSFSPATGMAYAAAGSAEAIIPFDDNDDFSDF